MKSTTSKATIRPPKKKKATAVPKMLKYKLPNGIMTSSQAKYLREWHRIGDAFGNIIGGKLFGFDPALSYHFTDNVHTNSFDPIVVIRILEYIEEKKSESYGDGLESGRNYNEYY